MTISLLAEVARRAGVPHPIVLVIAGLTLGFIPGLPAPALDPEVVFFVFLPPLVFSEAFLYSTEDLRAHALEIGGLAIGLVLATTVAVASVAHVLVGLPWPAAFVLGAVVGPTDPVAATAVLRRVGVSRRVVTVLEGESLVNDGTALVVYKLAIAAVGARAFSLGGALVEFVVVSLGGIAIGAVLAFLWTKARRWIVEPDVEITVSIAMPFAAYFPAERLGVSGVLAAVTAGLLLGARADAMPAEARLRGHGFWAVLVFLLNSTLFLLVGLGFPDVLGRLTGVDTVDLVGHALAIAATVMAIRLAWMFVVPRLGARLARARWRPSAGELLVLGWSGMRGGVSVAAALAVPVTVSGRPFPGRDEIIFLAYMVLLATLIVPGLTLGSLSRVFGAGSGERQAREDARARAHILRAALEHIEELARDDALPEEIADLLREHYAVRLERLSPLLGVTAAGVGVGDGDGDAARSGAALDARRSALAVQREALAELEATDAIGRVAAREIERELDREARTVGL